MDRFEMLIDRLREIARGMDSPRHRTLDQAADMLENQREEILGLQQIVEKQAYVNQRVAELALQVDSLTQTAMTGTKPKAYSTLCNMRKDELIEYIRLLEENHNTAVAFNHQQAKNFEKMLKGDKA